MKTYKNARAGTIDTAVYRCLENKQDFNDSMLEEG